MYVGPEEFERFQSLISPMGKEELQKKRESLTYFMKSMEKGLPYADGRAYYDDLNEIAIYRKKIAMIDEMIVNM